MVVAVLQCPDPAVVPQLIHGQSLSWIHGEQALGERLGLAADTAPSLAFKPEVTFLYTPHHVAGRLSSQVGVKW